MPEIIQSMFYYISISLVRCVLTLSVVRLDWRFSTRTITSVGPGLRATNMEIGYLRSYTALAWSLNGPVEVLFNYKWKNWKWNSSRNCVTNILMETIETLQTTVFTTAIRKGSSAVGSLHAVWGVGRYRSKISTVELNICAWHTLSPTEVAMTIICNFGRNRQDLSNFFFI